MITDLDRCRPVKNLRSITSIDLSNNKIEEPQDALDFFNEIECAELTVLYLKGNPFVKKTSYYRNKFITQLPSLGHLDDRPVFTIERQSANVWLKEGPEGELKFRQETKLKERQEMREKVLSKCEKDKEDRETRKT
eukprot:CAMPEP_0116881908 /NCGR_PEP_ID=MMETSP0463-20121206/13990_1 /TAXON_ID=181622 /ORGANISM="Strombidinopsis sp, Strain SopsisLIS2011" /LENGTH=135 /DNA_ID=CAMNT_0004534263 /DNA_START=507 /DNA_END=914 /DNA_ORIENTATION=-